MFKSLVTEICELYRQGLDESTIASILNMPVKDVGYVIDEYAKNNEESDYDDSMDGDFDSGMASAGYGTDEDYGYYGE
jgi:hypothetical protein